MVSPEQLFNQNQKLVYYCMKGLNIPASWYEDCIQEGMLELWRVCQGFDVDKGYKIATYAVPCIRGAIMRFHREKISTIRVPGSMWEEGRAGEVQIGSLDALVDTEKSEGTTFGDLIPAEPDFYPNLFEDTIDDFLNTIPPSVYHDVAEEVLYGLAFGEKLTQKELAEKYGQSQPTISRLTEKAKRKFKEFLNSIDKGGE